LISLASYPYWRESGSQVPDFRPWPGSGSMPSLKIFFCNITGFMRDTLFRNEVEKARSERHFGKVLFKPSLSLNLIFLISICLLSCFVCFLGFGTYTRQEHANGLLVPSMGIIKIIATSPGIVTEKKVVEGQKVQRGDVLFILKGIDSNIFTINKGKMDQPYDELLASIDERRKIYEKETRKNKIISSLREKLGEKSRIRLLSELNILSEQIRLQKSKVESAALEYEKMEKMLKAGYVSQSALSQKSDLLIEQKAQLHALLRSEATLLASIDEVQIEKSSDLQKISKDELLTSKLLLDLKDGKTELEKKRDFVITAPRSGIITAIHGDIGKHVSNDVLLTIIPDGSDIEAQLFLPSKSIGFLEIGQKVFLRYSAYPYQKFGQHEGYVSEISRTPLEASELPDAIARGTRLEQGESYFRIKVKPKNGSIDINGKKQLLAAGLALQANILQEKRTIWEILISPLLSIKDKL
jgi:membrane fusion protein